MTGEALLERVYTILKNHKNEINDCKAVLIEDDLDGRFHGFTEEQIKKYTDDIIRKVRESLDNQEMKVFLLYASPEAESWFIADWEHGFQHWYESRRIADLEYSERRFFVHHLKKYIDENVLKEYVNNIEEYGYQDGKYSKLSDILIDTIQSDIKEYLLKNSDNQEYAKRISNSRHLYYSKKLHGDTMLKNIVPEIVEQKCTRYFKSTYYQLKDFNI